MKVYIEKNNVQVELIRFRKKIATLFTLQTLKRPIHVLIVVHDESPLFGSEAPGSPDVSGHDQLTTSVWNVNSAL